MPETYKSFMTLLGTTANTNIYNGLCSGTAIVNNVNFSNVSNLGGVEVTLEAVRGSTACSLITNAAVPIATTFQALDSPIVLEANDYLRARAGLTGFVHVFVSLLEIT
jgi:hypothetical protein